MERTKEALLIPILLILLVVSLCYGNSFTGEFISDDKIVIVEHETIKSPAKWPKLFKETYWGDYYADQGNYRPLTNLSYGINYQFGGLNPVGYHIVNFLLHTVNSLLVYFLVLTYTEQRRLALFTALLFAAHPIHTEPVANIAGRPELLANTMALCAWLAYSFRQRAGYWYFISLFAFFLGMLAKESAIVVAGLVVLSEICFRLPKQNIMARFKSLALDSTGFLLTAIVYLAMRFSVLGQLGVNADATFFRDAGFLTRLYTMSQVLVKYLELLVWPANLIFDYDFSIVPQTSTLTLSAISSLLLLSLFLILSVLLFKRSPLITFVILCFFISISIVSNVLFPTGILMTERALYLPSISICLLVAMGLDRLYQTENWQRGLALLCLGLLLATAAVRCYWRNLDWQTIDAYAVAAVTSAPNNPKSQLVIGQYYRVKKDYQKAEQHLLNAVALAPDKATTHGMLGSFYEETRNNNLAIIHLKRSVEIYPKIDFVQLSLARVYSRTNNLPLAIEAFRATLKLTNKNQAEIHQELAVVLQQAGKTEEAIQELQQAVAIKSEFAEAHRNLGIILKSIGRFEQALNHLKKAIELEPSNAMNHYQAGTALLTLGDVNNAANAFQQALVIDGQFAEAHNNLGVVFLQLNRREEAQREFEQALKINPGYTNAEKNLALLKKDVSVNDK